MLDLRKHAPCHYRKITYRIDEIPDSRIKLIGYFGHIVALAITVKGYRDADYTLFGNALKLIGVVTANKANVSLEANYSMENISAVAIGIENDVVFSQLARRWSDHYRISVSFEERAHTNAARLGNIYSFL
jgi:hypothetical protein